MSLLKNIHLSPEDAMKALGIAPSEFSRYLAPYSKNSGQHTCKYADRYFDVVNISFDYPIIKNYCCMIYMFKI